MIAPAKKLKPKPSVSNPDLWEVKLTGTPISGEAITALSRLLLDRARRRLEREQAKTSADEGVRP